MAIGHALEDILKIGEWLDAVELRGREERGDDRPAGRSAVGAGEQMVLAAEGDGPDGAFDRVVVEFDAAVIEEAAKRPPAGQGIPHGFGETAAGRDLS